MDIFPLSIFPASSLASSIIPVVWVGIFVVSFFNLRLGWVLSGLIIPGYIVPLMLIKPWSAVVIFIESVATYFIVWFFSEYLSRRAPWSNFFGRDRFFALVLCSIFIRLLFDGWLLPLFGEWLNQTLQLNFDYRNHLHSFGLIIVALTANQFWKTGFIRGLIPLTVTLTVTTLIVRYGLMEFTNFSLSNIGYLYEDMASSILATPKAYIILISTAFIASRMNLKYGWDFNGILIPSLLALQWYQPLKILATIVEAGVILLFAQLLLKTPWLKKITIEGARKLLLFFNVSFAYKIVLGYAAIAWYPEVKVTDYFGFGYLLSTLMAVKIHDKAILARLTRATLQTSLASVLFATVIGYGLTLLPISNAFVRSVPQHQSQALDTKQLDENISVLLKRQEIQLYQAKVADNFKAPLAQDLDAFSRAIKLLQAYLLETNSAKLEQAANLLAQVNYDLDIIQQRYLYLHEKPPLKGWGVYVFDLQSTSTLAVSIPAPLNERGMIDAGVALFETLNAGSLAISGSSRRAKADLSADVLHNKQTFFHQFHRLVNRHDSLQLRRYGSQMARQITGKRRASTDFEIAGLKTTLWAKHHLPPSLNLIDLKQLVDDFQIEWNQPSFENQQREFSREGFAELILTPEAIRQLMFKPMLFKQAINYVEQDKRLEGYLQEWILDSKNQIAAKGSELYQQPKPEELLFADEQIISPLLGLASRFSTKVGWTAANQQDLQVIAGSADAIGYQLIRYKDRQSNEQYLILSEPKEEQQHYWGTFVFRLGQFDHYLVQIPRPLYEINSFEFGNTFFERINAQVLMIGATHPYANLDGSSDLIDPANNRNLFNLVNQVTLRETPAIEMLVVSCRAFSYRVDQPMSEADVMVALAQGKIEEQELKGLTKQLLGQLAADKMSVEWVDGSEETSGYEVGGASQADYLKATLNKKFATLWLSPLVRAKYRQQDQNYWQTAQFNTLGIKTVEDSLGRYVLQSNYFSRYKDTFKIRDLLFEYMDNPDILILQQVVTVARELDYQIVRVLDSTTKQGFLVIHDRSGKVVSVANLMPRVKTVEMLDKRSSTNLQIINFINQRHAWLQAGS